MKSWTLLRHSLDKLGRESAEVQLVREDVGKMQADLAAQEELWKQAEGQVEAEKASLRQQLEQLQEKVAIEAKRAEATDLEVESLWKQAEVAKLQLSKQKEDTERWTAQVGVEKDLMGKTKAQLREQLGNMSNSAVTAVAVQKSENEKLQKREAALLAQVGELEQRGREEEDALMEAEQMAAERMLALQKQVAELVTSKAEAEKALHERADAAQNLASIKAQLKVQTDAIVQVQQEHSQMVQSCIDEKQQRNQVLAEEEAKIAAQRTETVQLCGTVQGRHGVLKQLLQGCQASAAELNCKERKEEKSTAAPTAAPRSPC